MSEPRPTRPLRVLILEDRPADAELMVHELRRGGFDPDWTRVDTEADYLAALDPALDVVLADYAIPGFDTLGALDRLRERGLDVPVLVVSGSIGQEAAVEVLKRGATDYLMKDRLARLAPAVVQALEARRLRAAQRRAEDMTRGLAEVGRDLAASLDVARVADRIVRTVQRLFQVNRASLYRLDRPSADLICVATTGSAHGERWLGQVLPAGMGISGLAVIQGRPIQTPDQLADPHVRFPSWARGWIHEEDEARAAVSVPLTVGGEVLGTLFLGDRVGRVFDEEEIRLLTAFADQAALALSNARLYEEVQARLHQTEILLAVTRAIGSTLDLTETMRRLARETARAFRADMVGAYVPDPDGSVLRPLAGYHVPPALRRQFAEFPFPFRGHRFLEEAVAAGHPAFSTDVQADSRIDRATVARFPHRSVLFVPLIAEDALLGGLFVVWWRNGRALSDQELQLAEGIGRQAALAMENVRLYGQTERQRQDAEAAAAALRESEERFRSVFEHSATGMALETLEGRYVRVNRAFCELLGYTEQELRATTWKGVTHPEDLEIDLEQTRRLLAGELAAYQIEKRYVHKAGHPVWVLIAVSVVRTRDGQAVFFIVQAQDLTARRRAEAAQTELETQLRQAQKMEAIGRLAGGVAHDFNNLLTVILGRAQILLQRLPEADPLRRHAGLIQGTAERAGALTQQLLAFSRKQVLQPRVLDLNALVSDVKKILRRLLGEDIELVTVLDPALGRITADPVQLEQVIINLAVNARDAMPRGGRLTIETAGVEVDDAFVRANPGSRPGPHVCLAVRDTGTGMDAETRARIFEPFFTTKPQGKGTGLGLATVYGIVKQSGGYIGVDTEVGQGTTFSVYLPRAEDEAPSAAASPTQAGPATGSETILVVEDDEGLGELARDVLVSVGYAVLEARDGTGALEIGARHAGPIHLLLTDVVMPGLSGRDLADRVRTLRPETKVLYMSGYSDDTLGSRGVLEPDITLLPKPFTPDALARAVRAILDA